MLDMHVLLRACAMQRLKFAMCQVCHINPRPRYSVNTLHPAVLGFLLDWLVCTYGAGTVLQNTRLVINLPFLNHKELFKNTGSIHCPCSIPSFYLSFPIESSPSASVR